MVIFDRELIAKALDLVGEVEILAEGVVGSIKGVVVIERFEFSEEFDLLFDVFEGMTGFLHGIIIATIEHELLGDLKMLTNL